MSTDLRSAISVGRINDPDHGEFVIEDGAVSVDDDETADTLVARYGYLSYPIDDAETDDDDADESDDANEVPDDDDTADDESDAVADDGLDSLAYTDLQALAKDHDIKANLPTEELVAELRDASIGAEDA